MGESTQAADGSNLDEAAIAYTRVSTEKQVRNGRSLRDQRNWVKLECNRRGIELIETFTDKGESGTNFDRQGIHDLRNKAKSDTVSYLLVDELDRVGRHAVETLYYLYELRTEYGVKVISNEVGELDVANNQDLNYVTNRVLSAQSTLETQARRAQAGVARNFIDKKWSSAFRQVPLGYEANDEDDWISINPAEALIVEEAVETFIAADPARALTETLEEAPALPNSFTRGKLRRMLRRPLYIGRPTTKYVDYTRNDDSKSSTTVVDESLRIISDEEHDVILKKLEKMYETYSSNKEEADDVESLATEFSAETLFKCSEVVQIRCPDCDSEMMKDGRRKTGSRMVHNYLCPHCSRNRKFPYKQEVEEFKQEDS
ncbi:recombinase family protein [Haloarcula sp. Atlit-7R]|uniref:recombinase family protein n=1 Tax=Haloarcula sp. Atlit-7R TaxID=2282125 RepID=UPI0013141BBF|nr:recombinase family protein [Haloarcula sp. Atlit-7R]